MTFRLTCPVCGKRDIYEFTFGGQERGPRPKQEGLSAEEHFRWTQFRMIPCGPQTNGPGPPATESSEGNRIPEDGGDDASPVQREWWYHGQGCGVWFRTARDPATNREVRDGGDE